MEKAHFIEHAGKKIFILDVSGCQPAEMSPLIEECARQIRSQPSKSVYSVTIATGGKFDAGVIEQFKRLTKGNEPHVIKSAVVGVTGMQQVALMLISTFSNRTFEVCGDLEQAKRYIAADTSKP